jgi:hypothetical protein
MIQSPVCNDAIKLSHEQFTLWKNKKAGLVKSEISI